MKPFVVNVADLVHRPASRRDEHLRGPIGEPMVVTETEVPAGSELAIDVRIEAVSDGVLVVGAATVGWDAPCRRCLEPVHGVQVSEFRELYSEHPVEGETYPIRHEAVDLELVAREAILLDLPLAPLCEEGCRGLCVTCGANLNDGPCACPPVVVDPRWGALSELLPAADDPN
jgi:uncharacterized protein